MLRHTHHLFDTVLQVLYETGSQDLTLDLHSLPALPSFLSFDQRGTEERPLSITYRLPGGQDERDDVQIGTKASHCQIHVVRGSGWAGIQATHSDFTLEGTVLPYLNAGGAFGCTFLFSDATSCSLERWYEATKGEHFSATLKGSAGVRKVRLPENFFERQNRLLTPDGEGGWKEVRP